MSGFTVLYYPAIEPPAAWLRAAALFFDTVTSFVPLDAERDLSPALQEFADAVPGAFEPHRPDESLALLADVALDGFDAAFRRIARETRVAERKRYDCQFHPDGRVSVPGHVFMHPSKLSPRIRALLWEHGLMYPRGLAESVSPGYEIVELRASDLILSRIANAFAPRRGWSTLTDDEPSFAFVSVKPGAASAADPLPDARDLLARALIQLAVPADLAALPLPAYRVLRDRHADVRGSFQELVQAISTLHRLDAIRDVEVLRSGIAEQTARLDREIRALRDGRLGRTIRDWAPFCVGSLLAIAAAAMPEAPRALSLSLAGGMIALQALEKTGTSRAASPRDGTLKLLGDLRQDVLDAAASTQWA